MDNKIKIYGASWCKNTQRSQSFFTENEINITLLDIDNSEKGKEYISIIMDLNNGKRITPTIIIDGKSYANPTNKDLEKILENREITEDNITRCILGKELHDGDTVLLTRDLNVKGSSLNLKQGDTISKIKLTGDPAYVDARIGKSTISIKTEFIKKKG